MYEATPIVNGFPGKTDTHGSFGWSSVWLLRGPSRMVMVETGPPSYVPLITSALGRLGLEGADITDVLVTHAHWDHLGNVSLFPRARRWIGRTEFEWALAQTPDEPFVSQPLLAALSRPDGLLHLIDSDGDLFPGIHAHTVSGHTPGSFAFSVETSSGPIMFVGDAAKNLHELESVAIDSALDREHAARSVSWIRDFAQRTGAVVVPGHDVVCELTSQGWRRRLEQAADIQFFRWRDASPARIRLSDTASGAEAIGTIPPGPGASPVTQPQARAES